MKYIFRIMCYTFKVIYYVCWCAYVFLEYIFGNIAFVIWDLNTKNCFKLNFKIYLETPVNIDVYGNDILKCTK